MYETPSKAVKLDPLNSARPSAFMQLAIRLQAEHEQLKASCVALCELSARAASSAGDYGAVQMLKELRANAEELLRDLASHSKWEDDQLFPVISRFYDQKTEPTILPSLWVLEKDHELALQFFESSLDMIPALMDMFTSNSEIRTHKMIEKLKECCDQLTQGCLLLNGHFQMEEELVYPLTEQILTDMDYLFS